MDDKTQLVTGAFCIVFGIYLLVQGYRILILRKEVFIFIIRLYIWLNRVINGEKAAEKFKNEARYQKRQFYDGLSYFLIGAVTSVLGVMLLIELR